jgi:asparaginyl-tRNA synthetase
VYCRINELTSEKLGKTIVVKGWIRNVREQKTNVFIQVNDGSSLKHLQVIVESSKVEQFGLFDLSQITLFQPV